MNEVISFVAGVVVGAVAYALVVRKNPKVQADVSTAVTQAQPVVASAATEVKKL
jgi:uncharacterized membrane-anchored protein YhcB (DUF1043 family)